MTKPTQKRWVCPTCGVGVLAPGRPRRDDVRRYCLPCSAKTGRLVERTCPALDKARAATRTATAAKTKAKRHTDARRRAAVEAERAAKLDKRFTRRRPDGEVVDLRHELPRAWRAAQKVEPRLRTWAQPDLVASRGHGSYAYTYSGRIHLGRDATWHTLVHEVAHFMRAAQGERLRSDGTRAVHDRAFYYALRDVMEELVPGLTVSFYGVTTWGYNVDGVIARQVRALRDQV